MLLMGLFVSNAAYSQIIDKNGKQLVVSHQSSVGNESIEQLNNEALNKTELVTVYRYLVELQKVKSNYNIELKKNDYLNQQITAYQNQLALKDDMNENLQAYAEQVKAKWWQSQYAIIAYVVGAIAITYAVGN